MRSNVKEGNEEYNVFVRLVQEGATFEDWSPIQLTKALYKEIGEVRCAKKLRNGCLLVSCKDEAQQKKAIKVNKINGKKVKCSEVYDRKLIRGVITGIPVSESLNNVIEGITNAKIKEAKRLKTRWNGAICDSLSIMLTFDETKLHDKVFIGYMSYEVKMYIPPPVRCYKCQKYGHIAAICKGKMRCSKCSGEHEYGQCDKEAKLKCCNCGGEHSSAYRGCEVNKRMQEIQRIKVTQGISYAEATKKVRPTREQMGQMPTMREERKDMIKCKKCDKIKEETLIVDKNEFVLFMAEVINCSAQTTSRTERIKIIVKAAEKYMGIKGIPWESVRNTLNEEVQQQQSQAWGGVA